MPIFFINLLSFILVFILVLFYLDDFKLSDNKYIKFVSASTDGLIRIWIVDVGIKEKVWNAPDENGWVTDDDKNLLFWLPSNIRSTLIYGSCIRILNTHLSTKLTLSKYQGSQWTSCLPSSTIV